MMSTAPTPSSPRDAATHREPLPADPSADGSAQDPTRAEVVRVGLLGVNVWLVVLMVPVLAAGWGPLPARLSAAAPLLALAWGLLWLPKQPDRAGWVLLGGFVPLLGLGLVLRADAIEPGLYAAVSMTLSAVSLLGYAAAAARACSRHRVQHPAQHFPIPGRGPLAEGTPARWVRAALLAVTAAGAFFAVVIVPALGASEGGWGDARREGAVLTTVVAALAGAAALAAIVGPGLRAARRRQSRRRPLRRTVLVALGIAVFTALGWAALVYGNQL